MGIKAGVAFFIFAQDVTFRKYRWGQIVEGASGKIFEVLAGMRKSVNAGIKSLDHREVRLSPASGGGRDPGGTRSRAWTALS
jgi:hypothetical protein